MEPMLVWTPDLQLIELAPSVEKFATTGCFFTGPAPKVLNMELVPPNRKKSTLVPPKTDFLTVKVGIIKTNQIHIKVSRTATVLHFRNSARIIVTIGWFQSVAG